MAKAKKRTEAQLRKIMHAGYAARNELAERETARQNKENAGKVGVCQRYRNSYGSGESWWLYRKILSVDGSWCEAFTFQHCDGDRIEICHDKHASLDSSGWITITADEFDFAWKELQNTMLGWRALNGSAK